MKNSRNEKVQLDLRISLDIRYEPTEIVVPVELSDFYHVKYQFDHDRKKMTARIIPMVPRNLNTTSKSKIGELIGKVALEFLNRRIMELQESNCEFDILDIESGERYDTKFSLEHADREGRATYWKFCLKGDRAPKDYEQDTEYLLLIGTYNNPEIEPVFYLIPSDCREVKDFTEIRIATSGKSEYEKYRFYPFYIEE